MASRRILASPEGTADPQPQFATVTWLANGRLAGNNGPGAAQPLYRPHGDGPGRSAGCRLQDGFRLQFGNREFDS